MAIKISGNTVISDDQEINISGVCTASSFSGDGSALTGVISGVTVQEEGSSLSTSATTLNFVGDNVTATGGGATKTITISGGSGGISTVAHTPTGITTFLDLGSAQEHKITATGSVTISCHSGTEGESHTIRIINSGISTVGFSTYFLFPSGVAPSLPTTSGSISLVSFIVNRVGTAGTQLLSGVSVNFS